MKSYLVDKLFPQDGNRFEGIDEIMERIDNGEKLSTEEVDKLLTIVERNAFRIGVSVGLRFAWEAGDIGMDGTEGDADNDSTLSSWRKYRRSEKVDMDELIKALRGDGE